MPRLSRTSAAPRRGASRTLPLALLAFAMIGAGIAIVVFQGRPGTQPASNAPLPPEMEVAELLDAEDEFGTDMVIQITDADDPTLLTAEILAARYDPDGPTIRLVEEPEAWLFANDGSAWYIRADRGRFYIPEGEQNPREGTLTGGVLAKRFEPADPNADLRYARPDPEADPSALTATTDEPLRFNLDLLTFETDGRLEIETDTIDFAGRGAFVVLNEQRESITELRIDRGERIVYTPPRASTTDRPAPGPVPLGETPSGIAKPPASSERGLANAPVQTAPGASTPTASGGASPPKIDHYEIVFSDNVQGETSGQTIDADVLTVWARLIDNELPIAQRPRGIAPRSPIEAALITAIAAQPEATPGALDGNGIAEPDPATPPAEVGTQAGPSTAFAPDSVTLTWTGPLTVEPLADAPDPLTRGDDLTLRFEAREGAVEIRDTASGATATALAANYFATRERAELEGSGGSIVLASPEAGEIRGMNTVEIELASGMVTIPTAGELYGAAHSDPEPQSVRWADAASFAFAVEGGRMTDRLQNASFRGAVVGASRDARVRGESLVARFDPETSGDPKLRRVDVADAIATDGRDGEITGDELVVLFAEGTRGEDLDPTRAVITGNAVARRTGAESIRADWIDARLGRDAEGDVSVTTAQARGAVAFEDGESISGRGEALHADTRAETVIITGPVGVADTGEPLTWVRREGTRISGPDIRMDGAARTVEVIGPGTFEHQGVQNGDTPDRSIAASWSARMAFDDRAGTVLCLGGVEAESPGPDGSIDSVLGDRLTITLTPLQGDDAPEGDRLRFAEVFGSETTPARVESRSFAQDQPQAAARPDDLAIEALYRLESTHIRFAAGDDRVEVPAAGRLFVLDQRPSTDAPPEGSEAATGSVLTGPGGARGTTLIEWAGSMDYDRSAGRAVCRDDARIANKPIGTDRLREVIADTITAALGDRGADLRWAIAEGDALLRDEGRREILADRLIYNPEQDSVQALADPSRRVEVTDLSRGTTTNARAIIWELASDRLTITNPGAIVAPE